MSLPSCPDKVRKVFHCFPCPPRHEQVLFLALFLFEWNPKRIICTSLIVYCLIRCNSYTLQVVSDFTLSESP